MSQSHINEPESWPPAWDNSTWNLLIYGQNRCWPCVRGQLVELAEFAQLNAPDDSSARERERGTGI